MSLLTPARTGPNDADGARRQGVGGLGPQPPLVPSKGTTSRATVGHRWYRRRDAERSDPASHNPKWTRANPHRCECGRSCSVDFRPGVMSTRAVKQWQGPRVENQLSRSEAAPTGVGSSPRAQHAQVTAGRAPMTHRRLPLLTLEYIGCYCYWCATDRPDPSAIGAATTGCDPLLSRVSLKPRDLNGCSLHSPRRGSCRVRIFGAYSQSAV